MRIVSLLPVTAVLCITGTVAFADTMVQTQAVGLTNVGTSFGIPVAFNGFDPAQGTLTAVTLGLQADFSGKVGIENLSNVPDVASGVIAGSVTVATNDNSVVAEVFPSAAGPTHDLSAFDGQLDFAGTSGATDSVSGTPFGTTVIAPASALALFNGNDQILLTLTANTFALAAGKEREAVEETANGNATVQLTYSYTPVPEPGTFALLIIGTVAFLRLRCNTSGWHLRLKPVKSCRDRINA